MSQVGSPHLLSLPKLEPGRDFILLHGERPVDEVEVHVVQTQGLQAEVQVLGDGLVAEDGDFGNDEQVLPLQLA